MLFDPTQKQPTPAREGERYSTINQTQQRLEVNGEPVYPKELATFVAEREGSRLVWHKEVPLD
ncbi:MAG: hypothetical protein AAGG11_05050 [Pseudomonadota bacterium]